MKCRSRHSYYNGNIVRKPTFQSPWCQVEITCLTFLFGLRLWLHTPLVSLCTSKLLLSHIIISRIEQQFIELQKLS